MNWILRCVLPPRDAEAMLGDLEEECHLRSKARLWYWSQIVRSIPLLLWASIQRGGVLATFGAAIAACIVQAMVEIATKSAMLGLFALDARVAAFVTLTVTLPTLVLVSYLAARIRPGAATALAALIVIAVVIQLMVKAGDGMPLWNQFAALLVGPSAAFAGGVLSLRSQGQLKR